MIVLICLKTNEKKNSPSLKFVSTHDGAKGAKIKGGQYFAVYSNLALIFVSLTVLAIFYDNRTLYNLTLYIQTKFFSHYLLMKQLSFTVFACIMIIYRSNQII